MEAEKARETALAKELSAGTEEKRKSLKLFLFCMSK